MNTACVIRKYFYLYIFLSSAINYQLFAEGFLHGAQIKTPIGYVAIEQLQVSDLVICCDNDWSWTHQKVTNIKREHVTHYIHLLLEKESIYAAADQKFYLPLKQKWIKAEEIISGDLLLGGGCNVFKVKQVNYINAEDDFYSISVDQHHNFCVSRYDIHAHNFFPPIFLGFSWVFGLGGIEFAKASLAIAGTALALTLSRKNGKHKAEISFAPSQTGGAYNDPDDPEFKKQKRDEARNNYHPLTNKEARQKAKELGYKEDKNPPFDSHDKPTFRKGNDWISPDRDGHNGGVWKRFSNKGREGTYNIDLTKKIGN